jgi:hypothetical protein
MAVRRVPLALGIMLLASAALWRAVIAPRWTDRLPRGWSQSVRFAGVQTNAAPGSATLPARDVLGLYDRSTTIESESGRPESVLLRDALIIRDPVTRQTTFSYATEALVDPRTGAHLDPRYRGEIAVFPRQVEKQSYRLRANYVNGVPLNFEGEDDVAGLATYRFSYHGRGEYPQAFAGTPDSPWVTLKPGQRLLCADDQFYLRIWVEPLTGERVKVEEGCPSGDFVYDDSGRIVLAVDRWQGASSGTGLLTRVEQVHVERIRYLVAARVVPLLLILGGMISTLAAWLPRERREVTA